MHDPSVTKTFGASQIWLCEFRTEVLGSRPIRLVLTGRAVDLDHWHSPFVLLGLIDGDRVGVIGQHLGEGRRTDVPGARHRHIVLELGSNAQFRDCSSPVLPSRATLITKAAEVRSLVPEEISIAGNVEAVGTATEDRLVVQALESALGAGAEVMIHQVVTELARAAAESTGPDVGR